MPLRLALVDDHEIFREGLRAVLASQAEIEVVGEAADARGAVALARATSPSIMVMDFSLAGASGVDATREVLRTSRYTKVMMLTMHSNDSIVLQALNAGVRGYVLKDQTTQEIVDAIFAVARGDLYLAPRIPHSVLEDHLARQRGEKVGTGLLDELTTRERGVFDLVARGLTNQRIAHELSISVKTVETHRARINRKLKVHSTGELVRLAALKGLIVIDQ